MSDNIKDGLEQTIIELAAELRAEKEKNKSLMEFKFLFKEYIEMLVCAKYSLSQLRKKIHDLHVFLNNDVKGEDANAKWN